MRITRDFYTSGATEVHNSGDIVVYTTERFDVVGAVGFVGKSQKPAFNYRFKNADERAEWIAEWISTMGARLASNEQFKRDQKLARKTRAKEFKNSLKVGTILSDSWGYEQTNVEFYIVTAIDRSTVTIQEIGHNDVEQTSWASCQVMPDVNCKVGEPIKKRVGLSAGIKINSSVTLTLWDGRALHKSWYA